MEYIIHRRRLLGYTGNETQRNCQMHKYTASIERVNNKNRN
jgi:hypothetical protein